MCMSSGGLGQKSLETNVKEFVIRWSSHTVKCMPSLPCWNMMWRVRHRCNQITENPRNNAFHLHDYIILTVGTENEWRKILATGYTSPLERNITLNFRCLLAIFCQDFFFFQSTLREGAGAMTPRRKYTSNPTLETSFPPLWKKKLKNTEGKLQISKKKNLNL